MSNLFGQAMVIARRDFSAIVLTPTFFIFLLMPLVMLGVSGASGVGAATMATQVASQERIVAIAAGDDARRLLAADTRVRSLFAGRATPPALAIEAPGRDLDGQLAALLHDPAIETRAVLSGPLARPRISYGQSNSGAARYLAAVAETAQRSAQAGAIDAPPLTTPVFEAISVPTSKVTSRHALGVGAVFVIFLLTLLLAGQTVGTLAEERSNKVIEIMAAAVRVEAIFFGKLIGMFGVAVVFIGFWLTMGAVAVPFVAKAVSLSNLAPAIGLPLFLILCAAYFTMAFMLLGAVFLGIGSQAATMREIQMMTLPITMFQVAMFGLSAAAAGSPGSDVAFYAQLFPFSSPFAMAARGATDAALWPHLLALCWQALWVALTITIAARLFRSGVLKAGGGWRGLLGLKPQPVVAEPRLENAY